MSALEIEAAEKSALLSFRERARQRLLDDAMGQADVAAVLRTSAHAQLGARANAWNGVFSALGIPSRASQLKRCQRGQRRDNRDVAYFALPVDRRNFMGDIKAIEKAVAALPADKLAEFRRWFAEFDGAAWDRQIEQDTACGKLDGLAAEALADYRGGSRREP